MNLETNLEIDLKRKYIKIFGFLIYLDLSFFITITSVFYFKTLFVDLQINIWTNRMYL